MARKKVKLQFIANNPRRKATYKKRKSVLRKKLDEISTLCGAGACAIIYSPYDPRFGVWPSPGGVPKVVAKFRRMPGFDQSKKMLNQVNFLEMMIEKAKEKLNKKKIENKEKEMTRLMFQCLEEMKIPHNLSITDLKHLGRVLDQTMMDIKRKMEITKSKDKMSENQAPVVVEAAKNEDKAQVDHGKEMEMKVDTMQKQLRMMDLMNN